MKSIANVELYRAYEQKVSELEFRLNTAPSSPQTSPAAGMQAMIDSALQAANQRLASLKKAHQALLNKYTDLEIRYLELQAAQELESLPRGSTRDSAFSSQHSDMLLADEYQLQSQNSLGFHPAYRSELPSPDFEYSSMAHPHSYFHPANMHGPRSRPPTTPSIESRGYMNHMYQMSPNPPPATPLPPTPDQTSFYDDPTRRPSLRLTSSMPTMTETNEAPPKAPDSAKDDDTQTISNVSQTSSDRRRAERVKATSEVRIRGRGKLP